MRILLLLAIMLASNAQADELWLGFNSHHYTGLTEGCTNEQHDLLAYSTGTFNIGTYDNSHCDQSFFVGYQYPATTYLDLEVRAITGYDAYPVVILPTATLHVDYSGFGVRVLMLPAENPTLDEPLSLIGIGFTVKI